MKKFFITLSSVTILLIVLLVFDISGNKSEKIVLAFLNLKSDIEYKISDFKSLVTDYEKCREENKLLKEELKKLKINQAVSFEYKHEYERLYNLLDLKNEMDKLCKTTAAKIISYSNDNCYDMMVINKGEYSNISVGDSVISEHGVVGMVKETFSGYSIVSTVLNPDISFAVKNVRSGDVYRLNGDFTLMQSGLCRLTGTDNIRSIILSDVLVSTGYGIRFPDGTPVGTIKEIKTENSFSYAVVEPFVDFSEIREVLIVSSEEE